MENLNFISIDKDQIPYEFELQLRGETFQFIVNYNSFGDYFTIDLYRNHELIRCGEKVVYGIPLFTNLRHLDIPNIFIIPYDTTEQAERITYENLDEDVFLYVLD